MFKLESYVTPLILSYVDKYIKNIKPEDSQLSLWGGEAVFNNLDLKLDVLEHELNLPFTFVNGHIHELRINVPWTKLVSEPVVITINTIECILKLKIENEVSTESNSTKSSSSQHTYASSVRKQIRKQEYSELPPGYVQSLISRVINNICIVCNNIILKYVEDDIVLSLNIKSAEIFNANDKWERMFIELSHLDPVLRKVVNMQDMTVCLDRRDASGKIQVYQDPLLYRCSTIWRWYSAYDSPHSKQAAVTRIHVFCDKLDFSITDQQLPMLLRLGELCMLLLYSEISSKSDDTEKHGEKEESSGETSSEQVNSTTHLVESVEGNDVGWASWAWSFVPEILPLWEDEELDEFATKTDRALVQFGLFIDKASCVFKLSETLQDTAYYCPPKLSFQPIANLNLHGIANEMTKRGEDFTNVQLGITGIVLSGIGDCPCGDGDMDSSENENNYFQAGVLPSNSHTYNYCTSSLFDPLAPENCNQRREYTFDREVHISRLTESIMTERFPALSFDYFYELELPEDWQGSYTDITPLYLERNNFKERSLCRMVLGPSCLEISSDMVHRLLQLFDCASTWEYPPYNFTEFDSTSKIFPLSDDMIEDLEDFTPQRVYHGTLVKPLIHLHIASHPYSKRNLRKSRKQRKKDHQQKFRDARRKLLNKEEAFIVVLGIDAVDFHHSKPMYPRKMAIIASSTPSPSESLLYHCYSHLTLKVFGFEATLARAQKALHTIFSPCSFAACRKTLLLHSIWRQHSSVHLEEDWLEISSMNMEIRHSHLMALFYIYFSWTDSTLVVSDAALSVLLQNILLKDKPTLAVQFQEIEWHKAETSSAVATQSSVGKINIYLHYNEQSVSLLHGPEDTTNIHKASFFSDSLTKQNIACGTSSEEPCFAINYCWPKDLTAAKGTERNQSMTDQGCRIAMEQFSLGSVILNMKLCGLAANIDPAIKLWFSNQTVLSTMLLSTVKSLSDCRSTAASHTEESYQESSVSSSHTTTPNNSQTASKSQSLPLTSTTQKFCGNEMLSKEFVEKAIYLCNILKSVKAQVEIETCCILYTTQSWTISNSSILSPFASSLSNWKEAYDSDKLSNSCIFSLPHLKLQNRNSSNLKQGAVYIKQELLTVNNEDHNSETRTFSWTVEFDNFSIYSLHSNGIIHYILKPTSATATLADNTKLSTSLLPQLGFCIHVDMEPLHFCSSPKQVQLIMDAVKCVLDYHESCNMHTWMNNLRFSEYSNLLSPIDSVASTNLTPGLNPTTSNPAEIIDISVGEKDITSEEATSTTEASIKGEEKTKITLWLQWTLPKFSVSLFGKEKTDKSTFLWLQLEAEEIMLSLDIQETYIKAKSKVSSLNVISFQKRKENADWVPGPFCGIVLCSNNKLTHNIRIGSSKQLSASSFSSQTTDLQNRAFLTLTYTQALCKNVKKKLITKYQSQSVNDRKSDVQSLFTNQQCKRYVSEIDVQVHPFDAVLWMPLFSVINQMVSPLIFLLERHSVPSAIGSKGLTWNINSSQLPLLYVNCKTIRLFLPKANSEITSVIKDGDSTEFCNKQESFEQMTPDVCLLHIGSITVIPQADNPLSRIVVHKELYHAAQQSRTLAIPGSDIEDRQYQLDICGLAINTVHWNEFIRHSNIGNEQNSSHVLIMGENPALEWNTRLSSKLNSSDDSEMMCIPVLSQFDVKAIFAPAIIYLPPTQDGLESEDILVCGHSLELNMTNDIDIYLSIQQLMLFRDIFENNLFSFLHGLNELEIWNKKYKFKQKQKKDIIMDSGIESESSLLQQGVNQIHLLQSGMTLPATTETVFKKKDSFVPFEILLTAGSISLTSFAHENDDFCSSKAKHHISKKRLRRKHQQIAEGKDVSVASNQQRRNNMLGNSEKDESTSTESSPFKIFTSKCSKNENIFLNEEEGYDGSEDSSDSEREKSSKELNKRRPAKLYPFLYITIIQPHTFVSCHPKSQKFEISCFDIQVRGTTIGCYVQETDTSLIPLPEVFTVPWLETRPGEAHLKTGIPPSLYTFTCRDFLHEPAKVNMFLERPIKCNFSPSKWCQASLFFYSLSKHVFRSVKPNVTKEGCNEDHSQPDVGSYICTFRKAVSHLHSFKISSVQTAVVIDLGQKQQDLQVTFIVENMKGNLERIKETEEKFSIDVKGLLLKTCFQGNGCPVFGPFSMRIQVILVWKSWHLWTPLPQLLIHLQGDTVLINFGPKQFENIQALCNIIAQYLQNAAVCSKTSSDTMDKGKLQEPQRIEWSDDLRKGSFQYIQDSENIGLEPQPCEIVFCKEHTGERGSMTWCYPEPRALRCVTVYPVPLHPSATLPEGEECIEQVECSLQYWDKLHQSFINYCNFHLSETHQYNIDLPVISSDIGHIAVVSEMWRIVLYNTEKDTKAEILSSGALSPLVLAACMRVDSFFDPACVSILSASINFDLLQISLYNCFKNTEFSCKLQPFTFDDQIPQDQEFAMLSIDGLTLNCKKWHQQFKLDVLTSIGCEILEYRNLTMQTLLEPFDVQGHLYINMESEKPSMYEAKITLHPCFIHINQSTIHTLNIAMEAWEQIFSNSVMKKEQLVPNHYIICNNTHQAIYIGQVDTDETIMLPSQKMHAYSWRSRKTKQLLHICVESMKWKWCDGFSLDSNTALVQTVKNKEFALTFIIKFVPMSNMQKQIIIDGQLIISSKLNQHLEVQMQTVNSALPLREWTGHKITAALYKQSTLPSFTLNRYQIRVLRIRLMGIDNPWSENIVIVENKTPFCKLVKVPMKATVQHLSIWCHVLDQQVTQTISKSLVLFAPLFIVRNHLPHSLLVHLDSSLSHCVEVTGQGREHQLTTTGNACLPHSLSFQMAPDMKMSAPAISISSTLINEIKETSSQPCFSELQSHSLSFHSLCWPYDNPEINSQAKEYSSNDAFFSDISNPNHSLYSAKPSELPDIELQVGLSQRWSGCNTVLVDVKPCSLLINKTNIDLFMMDDSGQEWKINRHSVFTPPFLQKEFRIALRHKGTLFSSNPVQLSDQNSAYWTKPEGILSEMGQETIAVEINDEKCLKVFLFLVTSRVEESMVIISIQPTMYITNASSTDLLMVTYALPSDNTKNMSLCNRKKPTKLKASSLDYSACPILWWEVASSASHVQNTELNNCFEFSHFLAEENKGSLKLLSTWSYSVNIDSSDQIDRRYTFVIPEEKQFHSKPYVMTYHKRNGVSYLVVKDDPCPMLMLHNNTQYTLTYGQGTGSNKEGEIVLEDAKTNNGILVLRPAFSSYYTLPIITKKFPDYVEYLPPIHFAEYLNKQTLKYWSVAVDVTRDEDQFLNIVNCGDVRIYKERTGHTRHIFIDPVNRVEVSAREIRSRIGVNAESPGNLNMVLENQEDKDAKEDKLDRQCSISTTDQNLYIPLRKTAFYLSLASTYICFIICDNSYKEYHCDVDNKKNYLNEILRLNIDNILAISRPHFKKSHQHMKRLNHYSQEVSICIGKIQIDNQISDIDAKRYDFPVVVVPQNNILLTELHQLEETSFQTRWSKVQKNSHIVINLLLGESCEDIVYSQVCIESLHITIQPFSLYIEDSFYYKLLELQTSFIPSHSQLKQCVISSEFKIPKDVIAAAAIFSSPIHIHHMHIDSLNILVSLHASVKLYLAIDHSPLTFKPFDKTDVFTTSYKLGHMLTHHFLTGALLRAGWVVGSLDLLGNPAGFARAVGSGMADFFRFPYHGLLQGPWAFISGISHGSASLLQQITSGAVVSVTNLAASVSRNMDLLSMDADHLSRQEELRRQKPQGISMGLLQGLTGFGISLLGSIAGIIEQPIQEILSQQPRLTPGSSVRAATGFVKGVGKGLVGVVAKPIGGAAELVSQAGQGFLEGAGWRKQPVRQHWPVSIISDSDMSKMKFLWKISQSITSREVFLCTEATHINQAGKHITDSLLLTTEVLFILNKDDDSQQQRFLIAEVDCHGTSNRSEICIMPKQHVANLPEGPENQAKDRIEEYINKTSQYSVNNFDWKHPSPINSTVAYHYYIHPKLKPVVLAIFNLLQRKLLGKGFSV